MGCRVIPSYSFRSLSIIEENGVRNKHRNRNLKLSRWLGLSLSCTVQDRLLPDSTSWAFLHQLVTRTTQTCSRSSLVEAILLSSSGDSRLRQTDNKNLASTVITMVLEPLLGCPTELPSCAAELLCDKEPLHSLFV